MFLSLLLATAVAQASNDAIVPVPRPDDWWTQRHAAAVDIASKGNIHMIFIGDSITHGFGGAPGFQGSGEDTWDWFYGDRHGLNLGFSGDRTQHVLWRLAHGEMDGIQPKVIQIMIGTNNVNANTAMQIAEGVEAVCTAAHYKAPKAKELLLAIFPRDTANSASRKKIFETNSLLQPWAASHGVKFLDISHVFLDSKGELPPNIMPDKLHPNAFGYRKWAMATEPTLAKLLRQRPKTKDDPMNTALVPVTQNRDQMNDWIPRYEHVLSEIKQNPSADVVFIGDSITAGMGAEKLDNRQAVGQPAWDQYLNAFNPINEGFGWDRTENVLWRVQEGELDGIRPKAIVLLIGTNNLEVNTPEEIRAGIQAVLRDVHAKQPQAHILLLGLLPRGQTSSDGLRERAHQVNLLLENTRLPRGARYLEIWDPFLASDGSISADVMSDYLHPTAKGYEIEMSAIAPILTDWLRG